MGELVGDALVAAAPEGLIGQRDGELLAVRIGDHAGELAGLGALLRGLLCARLTQERFSQLDGAMGEALSDRDVVRRAHARLLSAQCDMGALGGAAVRSTRFPSVSVEHLLVLADLLLRRLAL